MLSPIPASKWSYATAAHLISRAGFGGTPNEIEEFVKLGPEKAVGRLVDYELIPDNAASPSWAKPDPDRVDRYQTARKIQQEIREAKTDEAKTALEQKRRELVRMEQREQQQQILELRGWWLKRMVGSPRPLQEKLTLFWHGHFATSAQKVKNSYFMWLQNDTFRKHASGNWLKMLNAVGKDPAMLIWLDQAQSRRMHPNENFAREVMELFALGEGNYTEKDVTEAARALTGWTLNRVKQEFVYRSNMHDPDEKVVLGKKGNLTGNDVLEIIVAQPQAAKFITAKLWSFFAAENPSPELVEGLANLFRKSGNNFKPLLRAMFLSEEFYSDAAMRNQVKSPVQWLVGSTRLLERDMPPSPVTTQLLRQLGQDLFMPPNVKGWDGGLSWITTNSLLSRYNFAALLVFAEAPGQLGAAGKKGKKMGRLAERGQRGMDVVDVAPLVPAELRKNKDQLLAALEKRFLQAPLKEKHRATLKEFLKSKGTLDDDDLRHAVRLVMSTPEYQLT